MMDVYREILPDSYLLILTDTPHPAEEEALRRALHRASSSGKPSVWVDCSHLHHFSEPALHVLAAYYQRLQHRHIQLVLCHVAGPAYDELQQLPGTERPPVVATLLEAAGYCRSQQRRPARGAATASPPPH